MSTIEKNDFTKDIPIIFITAKTETEDIVEGFNLGSVDYITKPFRQEEVCVRVANHLQLMAVKKKLKKQNETLSELNELKNKFVGMAAHDLRGPLGGVLGISKLIKDERSDISEEDLDEYSGLIVSATEKMLDLVNNLLDISVIESGKLDIEKEPNSLNRLCLERIHIFSIQAEKKKIKLHRPELETEDTHFDRNRISQVIDNLISNAIKFSPQDSNIYILLEKNDSGIKLSVRDEGPGISGKDQEKLFGGFQKLSAKPTGGEKSTGLGLSIVKKIVTTQVDRLKVEGY